MLMQIRLRMGRWEIGRRCHSERLGCYGKRKAVGQQGRVSPLGWRGRGGKKKYARRVTITKAVVPQRVAATAQLREHRQ